MFLMVSLCNEATSRLPWDSLKISSSGRGLPVVGNELKLNEETIKENLRKVHDRNGLEESKELHGLNFSVEMEIFLTCYSADP